MQRDEKLKKFQDFFKAPDGDYVLEQIDELCGYKMSTFDPDPYIHSYKAGQRSIAIGIHELLERKER